MYRITVLLATLIFAACSSTAPSGIGSRGGSDGGDAGSGGGPGGGGAGGGGAGGVCGDGRSDLGEECDDGNARVGDGCSAACTREGPECRRDQECDWARGEFCFREGHESWGVCTIDGRWCEADAACAALDPVRCPTGGSCYCRPMDGDGETRGVCWQGVEPCGSCETDADCGASELVRHASCVTYHYAGAGQQKLCLPEDVPGQTCPPGFVAGGPDDGGLDMTGSCVPASGSCPQAEPCREDADCRDPNFPSCDLQTGACTPGCYVDAGGTTVGCGAEKPACHARPDKLDPSLLNNCATAPAYALGKCGIECRTDTDCEHRGNDVNGEPWVCRVRGGHDTCAPRGCLADEECPEVFGIYPGYCDPYAQACVYDRCRLGQDLRGGCGLEVPYADCAPGFTCTADSSGGDTGTCEPTP